VNPKGHTRSLVASHPRNANAHRSGAFSRAPRPHGERADEIAEAIMSARHVDDLDGLAANVVGRLVSLIEAIDGDIERRGTLTRAGDPRRISGRDRAWGAASPEKPRWLCVGTAAILHGSGWALLPARSAFRGGSRATAFVVPPPRAARPRRRRCACAVPIADGRRLALCSAGRRRRNLRDQRIGRVRIRHRLRRQRRDAADECFPGNGSSISVQ
jgi:hypothetical protein